METLEKFFVFFDVERLAIDLIVKSVDWTSLT